MSTPYKIKPEHVDYVRQHYRRRGIRHCASTLRLSTSTIWTIAKHCGFVRAQGKPQDHTEHRDSGQYTGSNRPKHYIHDEITLAMRAWTATLPTPKPLAPAL